MHDLLTQLPSMLAQAADAVSMAASTTAPADVTPAAASPWIAWIQDYGAIFIFVAFMVVDENTTPDIRATAQNLFNLVIVGIGIIVGSLFATSVVAKYATAGGEMDYQKLFSVPMYMALGCLVLMFLFYPSKKKAP